MTQQEAMAYIQALKWFFDANGLYASIQQVHGEYQVVIRTGNVYEETVSNTETVGTNSKVGKQSEPYWVKMGLDGPLSLTNH